MGDHIESTRTGKELLTASLAGMFSGKVDKKTKALFSARRGPSSKKVRVAHKTLADKAYEAGLTEVATDNEQAAKKPAVLKTPREASFYKAELVSYENGAARVYSRYFGEEILVPKKLAECIAADKSDFAFDVEFKVQVVEKPGNPRLKAVTVEIDSKRWTLADAEAWATKIVPKASKQKAKKPSGFEAGTLKWFNYEKGYGFVVPDDGGIDVFLHIGVVERMIGKGQQIPDDAALSFKRKQSPKDGRIVVGSFKILKSK